MNVLMIDIDTLRPDHMGCYGYRRNTTPNIDEVAKEGVRFQNLFCSDAPCLPSRASLLSGMFGIKNGVVGHGGTAADRFCEGPARGFRDSRDQWNFHNIFRRAGLYTASVSTFPERHSAWWFQAGLNETFNQGEGGLESGEKVLPYALDWLDKNGTQKDWFLHVHFWDPHTPYRAPESFGNPFEADELDHLWINDEVLELHKKHVGPHSASELNMWDDKVFDKYPRHPGHIQNMQELKRVFDGYDCGIAHADYLVGQILQKLKSLNIYEDTAVIITADHGENLGELGLYSEHGTADKPCCNIPLIIKWPGARQNAEDHGLHYSLDLLPTIAELFNVEKAQHWDGQSFRESLFHDVDTGRESLVLSQMAHVCQRSARFGDWLYIRSYHDGFHLFDREMLFNLREDPYEQHDVKEQYPEIVAKGAKIILDWHDQAMLESPYTQDPMWTVLEENGPFHTWDALPEYLRRLEQTGRADGAEKLRQRYHIKS